MSSDVDICNLALGYLGDAAAVQSINPADSSAQAGHCARFYPMARDALLEMHQWGFSTLRVNLAQSSTTPPSAWTYAYTPPSNVLNYIAILDPNATDDESVGVQMANTYPQYAGGGVGIYTPQPFIVESDPKTGVDILYTNVASAVLRYTQSITDSTLFSPLFTECLALLLAHKLAGPLIKGAEGRAASAQMYQMFTARLADAIESDANQRRVKMIPGATWMVNR